MSTAVPAVRYFAEFQHAVQVTSRKEGARRENWVTIIVPQQSPEPIARFTAPYVPNSRRIGPDDLLQANGWRAVGPWEYIAGPNYSRARVEPMRSLITAGQSAVRAAEDRACEETLVALERVLTSLHPEQGSADRRGPFDAALANAEAAVRHAKNRAEWALLADVEHAVSRFLHEPDGATMDHPAVRAVVLLTSECGSRVGKRFEDPAEQRTWIASAERRAWDRAFLSGLEALRTLGAAINGTGDGRALDKAMTEFTTAVRRAIPYQALYEVRRALVEAARAYGLFVVGMRQPMPESGWEWARRIGSATYLFAVTPPLVEGPYGAVEVLRVAEDGTAGPVRYFPLGSDGERRRAVAEALFRI
ncbi:hypothetical protein [Streptomyces rimosus]|uniref:hypothetical protein n=1 Tax=Streptomyces rimosus TaxID=1927 RepID=UPI0004C0E1EA|nr:hypothetical protein [Streptomyces rimosus]